MKTKKDYTIEVSGVNYHMVEIHPDNSMDKWSFMIIIHGLTGSMDEEQLWAVADEALRHGMAILMVDMYGHGKSSGVFYDHTVPKWVDDTRLIIDYVKGLDYTGDIYLCGHSQGGLTAMLAGGQNKDQIKGLLLLSPAVCIVTDTRKGIFFGEQYNTCDIPDSISFWEEFTISGNYLRTALSLPLESAIEAFDKPVSIINGTADESTPYSDAVWLEKQYKNARLYTIEGAGHCYENYIVQLRAVAAESIKHIL